jgi:hypothetical protein
MEPPEDLRTALNRACLNIEKLMAWEAENRWAVALSHQLRDRSSLDLERLLRQRQRLIVRRD